MNPYALNKKVIFILFIFLFVSIAVWLVLYPTRQRVIDYHWQPPSSLLESDIGFRSVDGQIYYAGKWPVKSTFKIWVYDEGPSVPTYATRRARKDIDGLYFVGNNHFYGSIGLAFDLESFTAFKTPIEDNSCGYLCKYDAADKNHKYSGGKEYSPLPAEADVKTFSILYTPSGYFSGLAKDKNNIYTSLSSDTFSISRVSKGASIYSFEALGGGYFRDEFKIYSEDGPFDISLFESADRQSFYYDEASMVGRDAENTF